MASRKPRESAEPLKLERFEMAELPRKELRGADYNPRTISDAAKRKLRQNIERVGLLTPIVWNKRTGNVVSGHQRLAAMDALQGSDDYSLNVAVVDMDEKTEREQNIFFNNPEAMGDWDMDALKKMFEGQEIDAENTGFEVSDVAEMFGLEVLADKDIVELSERLTATSRRTDEFEAADNRKAAEDLDYYVVLVFDSNNNATEFVKALGLKDDRFINGMTVWEATKGRRASQQEESDGDQGAEA